MINPTPSDLGKFPVPPSGQPIPRGWFGRLVRFINSLILHGDGQYLTVKHTLDGQTITPTPALLQALGNGGAPPAAGGGVSSGLFPVYSKTENHMAITPGVFYSADQDFWLMGTLKIVDSTAFQVRIRDSTNTLYTSVPVSGNDYISGEILIHYVCVPIPANRKFYLTGSSSNAWQCNLEPFGTNGNDVILTTYNS